MEQTYPEPGDPWLAELAETAPRGRWLSGADQLNATVQGISVLRYLCRSFSAGLVSHLRVCWLQTPFSRLCFSLPRLRGGSQLCWRHG